MSEAQVQQVSVVSPGEFRVGRVLGLALTILFKDFAKFFVVALIVIAPGVLFVLWGGARTYNVLGVSVATYDYFLANPSVLTTFLFSFGSMFLHSFCQAAALYGAFQDMRGREFHLGRAFAGALRRIVPIIGLTICALLAVYLGLLLLIVPGLMLIARFFVSLPCCVVEGLGPIRSLRRSGELTKGHRWRLFGIFILIIMISSIGTPINIVFTILAGPVAGIWAGLAWSAFFAAYIAIVAAVAYHDLRVLKEGIDIDRIAAVFD